MVLTTLIVVLVSLFSSAMFSGMEIAFLSANKLKLEIDKQKDPLVAFVTNLFARNSGQYITTILVGNNLALVIYSLFMSQLIQAALGVAPQADTSGWLLLIETVVSTLVILFTAEYLPKAMVRLNPNFYYRIFAIPAFLFYILFYPIAVVTTFLSTLLLKAFRLPVNPRKGVRVFDRVDLAHLVDKASESTTELEHEKDIRLFQNALDFSDLQLRDCMVHRVDIEAVDCTGTIEELTARFVDTRYSRLLIYRENIDQIIGYVNTKSLFKTPATIDEILKEVVYVPESMPAQWLLSHFIKSQYSVAVVIDEFGGTAGMVTIEDILEEIFGEIEDEHDSQYLIEKRVAEKEFVFSGRLEVEYLNDKYRLGISSSERYDTLAGYVIDYHQGIPEMGDVIVTESLKLKILRVQSSKLELIRVTQI